MQKIPTLFERDWNGDKSRVVNKIHAGCEWVANGEGIATRKIDGTSCLMRGGNMFKRRELREGDVAAPDFELATKDEETGKSVGWVPVDGLPENKYHMEAFDPALPDGTYELVGPKVQKNLEKYEKHTLVKHSDCEQYPEAPRTFYGLRAWLEGRDIEGLVFHHPDGRMAKIKLRDFGIKRTTL